MTVLRTSNPMFQYKKRLQGIRSELNDIDEKTSPLVNDGENEQVKTLALSVCRLARILIRVIDSLPG